MKTSLSRFAQRARPYALSIALACAVTAAAGVAWAQTRISPTGVGVSGSVIGDDVLIGHLAMIHGCTIESGAFVGMKACVMDGVVVETGAMVAAGALVTPGKRVKRGELWAGSPAKLMRMLSEGELKYFAYSAEHYREMAASYRNG